MPNDNIQNFTSAPTMVRMANGTYAPVAHSNPNIPLAHQKLLIVIQYYEGDKESAEDLASLIADLERIQNKEADILIFRRFDASEFSRSVRSKLEDKFDKVYFETCRRRDGKGYPFAPNQMWNDLVTLVAQFAPWKTNYYAFLPLEADCTPVHPGWIRELISEFRMAKAHSFAAVGHIHNDPVPHMNGVAVYDINLWRIVGAGKLNGGNPQVAYDIYHARDILPIAQDTASIMFQYQRPTIAADDLFRPWKNGIEPALFHGVKDASAREAVRAKHITFSQTKDLSRRTVFTYQHQPAGAIPAADQQKLDLWFEGWKSRGWNPVVLRARDAARSPRYTKIMERVNALPCLTDRAEMASNMARWVALDLMGAGLMVDVDVLPGKFVPENLTTTTTLFNDEAGHPNIVGAFFTRKDLAEYLTGMADYIPDSEDSINGRAHISDLSILKNSEIDYLTDVAVYGCGTPGWSEARMVEFSLETMILSAMRGSPVQAMENYLRQS
jgi:hypothetical protein